MADPTVGRTDLHALLGEAARVAADYRAGVSARPVRAMRSREQLRAAFGAGDVPEQPSDAHGVLEMLVAAGSDGLVATAGPRFFGFVIGGSLDAATAADVLAAGWDQCAYNEALSPAAAAVEDVAGSWAKQLLGLPATATVGFVTGAQAANTVGLAAARHHVLANAGWDVERNGLVAAPQVRVIAGEERHATVDRSLRLLGLGTACIEAVRAERNGAIDPDHLAELLRSGPSQPTIVCLQAGNVNTGAVDDFRVTIPIAKGHGAWVHVDGAFGLWAAANPRTAHLTAGVEAADSWGCDAHKWLNVPYDSGLAICAHPEVHAAAMSYSAAYLTGAAGPELAPGDLVPDSSRRARGFAVWAAIRQLGRDGVADLVERCCRLAQRMADRLAAGGATIHNDVVLNQVLVGFDGVDTDALTSAIQQDGTCWLGATTWRGRRLMRVSISNWQTSPDDIDASADAILRLAADGHTTR
jgi:glutamate/tyrosine decarboxylase-like PLP-dependent enzyme